MECNHLYMQTIASHLIFCFWTAIIRTYERLQVISYFIFGLQLFTHTNDCKPYFLKKSLECNHSYVHMIASHLIFYFLNLWTAIIRIYEQLQAMFFYKKSLECNRSYVQMIASHLILNFPTCHHLYVWIITVWKVWGYGLMVMV